MIADLVDLRLDFHADLDVGRLDADDAAHHARALGEVHQANVVVAAFFGALAIDGGGVDLECRADD